MPCGMPRLWLTLETMSVYCFNLVTLAWFLNRAKFVAFDHAEWWTVAGHWFAKLFFGAVVMMGLADNQ